MAGGFSVKRAANGGCPMTKHADDIGAAVRDFYERYPYPAVVETLERRDAADRVQELRAEHHLVWPRRAFGEQRSMLIAGCGSSQAARHAMRWPQARVIGIDVSAASLAQTQALKERHRLDNLELRQLPIERVAELETPFDWIVCTGVLHHLPDPDCGLRALRGVLAPGGAIQVMLYAPYGRAGIYLLQEYCRRVGIGTAAEDVAELAQTLKSLPARHPIWPLLRESPDFRYPAGIADALLHPQDRPYSVPQFLAFFADNGLRFGRWLRQAPYLPHCGAAAGTPHHARLAALPEQDQYAAMELFRGSMLRHTAIAWRDDEPDAAWRIRFDGDDWPDLRPIRLGATVCVEERLPPGTAGVLINRRHTDTDLYLPIDATQKRWYAAIDGRCRIRDIVAVDEHRPAACTFFEQLWRYDQVVFDATAGA